MVPLKDFEPTMNWQAVSVTLAVVTAVVLAAVAYLKLLIKSSISDLQNALETKIEGRFAAKETITAQLGNILTRIEHVERAVDRLEKRD